MTKPTARERAAKVEERTKPIDKDKRSSSQRGQNQGKPKSLEAIEARAEKAAKRAELMAGHQNTQTGLPDTFALAEKAELELSTHIEKTPITKATINTVIHLVSLGHTLTSICGLEGAPNAAKFMRVVNGSDSYLKQLTRAREDGAALNYDKTLDIANESCLDSAAVQRNKLRIDALTKHSGKYNAKFADGMNIEQGATLIAQSIIAARGRHKAVIAKAKRKVIDITPEE